MKSLPLNIFTGSFSRLCLTTVLLFTLQPSSRAEPVAVRHVEGTLHGFLSLRTTDGHLVAAGDLIQTVRGGRVTAHLIFHFKDGSLDDETTVFSQRRTFQLISDHHIQKGPFFPHPMDLTIDARSGQVTLRSTSKDGKPEVTTDHIDLPPDLANGMVSMLVRNLPPQAVEANLTMLIAAPKPRVVKLVITPRAEDPFTQGGFPRKASHFDIKFQLGGVAGVVAPLIGKQPPDVQLWILGGEAPTFVREEGITYESGPTLIMELHAPEWSPPSHSAPAK
jgi:hypothetical protein